ncbi:MAG: hypothetical protein U0074_05605 [Kouleothrix sp.]
MKDGATPDQIAAARAQLAAAQGALRQTTRQRHPSQDIGAARASVDEARALAVTGSPNLTP